ncbi:MAG TPA: hypothetical protein VHW23_15745 [Kofleriaceae bacterium]|jgi:hypothetical protein|nr:hypothetical protein [Kofleriaceae bacterium]
MPTLRYRSSCALAVVLALAACSAPTPSMSPSPDNGGGTTVDAPVAPDASAVRPDAYTADGGTSHADAGGSPAPDAAPPGGHDAGTTGGGGGGGSDAGSTGGGGGSDAGSTGGGGGGVGGTISCYSEGSPGASCTLPTHCCFTNYSSQHDGACTTAACTWGTIECDGPEDCASGQHCCAHAIVTPDGLAGYQLACQASACGMAPANEEMCHPTASAAGTCSNPSSQCVTAFGNDNDLPPSLHICQ